MRASRRCSPPLRDWLTRASPSAWSPCWQGPGWRARTLSASCSFAALTAAPRIAVRHLGSFSGMSNDRMASITVALATSPAACRPCRRPPRRASGRRRRSPHSACAPDPCSSRRLPEIASAGRSSLSSESADGQRIAQVTVLGNHDHDRHLERDIAPGNSRPEHDDHGRAWRQTEQVGLRSCRAAN
jgi:hypothetical protein